MSYISKEERQIPIDDPSGKWSELFILPEWEDDYCDVYTVKKHGKWVMLKALKKEFADNPEYQKRLEEEFDTRYNLCHPNIVMVNDFEIVPGVGKAIITDDVYGYSLRRLIDEKRLTPKIVHRLQTQLLDAMEYIQDNHIRHVPISPETIIFTEYNENLKLTDVGFAKLDSLTDQDTRADIESYGKSPENARTPTIPTAPWPTFSSLWRRGIQASSTSSFASLSFLWQPSSSGSLSRADPTPGSPPKTIIKQHPLRQ